MNRELNHRLVSAIHHVLLHSWLTTAGSDFLVYIQLNCCYASTIPFAFGLGQKRAAPTPHFHSPFSGPGSKLFSFAPPVKQKPEGGDRLK